MPFKPEDKIKAFLGKENWMILLLIHFGSFSGRIKIITYENRNLRSEKDGKEYVDKYKWALHTQNNDVVHKIHRIKMDGKIKDRK